MLETLILPILGFIKKTLRFKPILTLKSIKDVYLQNIKILNKNIYFCLFSDFYIVFMFYMKILNQRIKGN